MSFITNAFKPKVAPLPTPAAPPPPPTVEDATAMAQQSQDAQRRRMGRAATQLSGVGSSAAPANTATKQLLGS